MKSSHDDILNGCAPVALTTAVIGDNVAMARSLGHNNRLVLPHSNNSRPYVVMTSITGLFLLRPHCIIPAKIVGGEVYGPENAYH